MGNYWLNVKTMDELKLQAQAVFETHLESISSLALTSACGSGSQAHKFVRATELAIWTAVLEGKNEQGIYKGDFNNAGYFAQVAFTMGGGLNVLFAHVTASNFLSV